MRSNQRIYMDYGGKDYYFASSGSSSCGSAERFLHSILILVQPHFVTYVFSILHFESWNTVCL